MSNIIGYARVSSEDQNCSIQEAALREAGCTIIRSEKKSGTIVAGRQELDTILAFLRTGDTLMVTRIDRLARSVADLEKIVETLKAKGAFLRATEQAVDTSAPAGIAFLQMLGVFAQFETAIRRERQMEGIAKAKAQGFTKAVNHPFLWMRSAAFMQKVSGRPTLPSSLRSDGAASTGL